MTINHYFLWQFSTRLFVKRTYIRKRRNDYVCIEGNSMFSLLVDCNHCVYSAACFSISPEIMSINDGWGRFFYRGRKCHDFPAVKEYARKQPVDTFNTPTVYLYTVIWRNVSKYMDAGVFYGCVVMLTVPHMWDLNVGKPDGLHDWPLRRWLRLQFNRLHAGLDWLNVCSIRWQKALNSNKPVYSSPIIESTASTTQLTLSPRLSSFQDTAAAWFIISPPHPSE